MGIKGNTCIDGASDERGHGNAQFFDEKVGYFSCASGLSIDKGARCWFWPLNENGVVVDKEDFFTFICKFTIEGFNEPFVVGVENKG